MYHYWGCGLLIASEIEFPELLPYTFETAEVVIRLGKTPESINGDDVIKRVRVWISPTEYLLKTLNIANYYVTNGNSIVVEPIAGADDKSIRLFLLSNAMAAVLHQRDMILLHASAIEHEDGVVLFCGDSGAGKSTTVSALRQKGYKVFSDDVVVLRYTETKQVEALSSYPMVKLWADSYEKLDIATANENAKIRPLLDKYANYFHSEFNIRPSPIKQIFILEKDVSQLKPTIKKLNAMQAFTEVQKKSYRQLQIDAMQKTTGHFLIFSALTANVPTNRLCRPENGDSIAPLTILIEECLNRAAPKNAEKLNSFIPPL